MGHISKKHIQQLPSIQGFTSVSASFFRQWNYILMSCWKKLSIVAWASMLTTPRTIVDNMKLVCIILSFAYHTTLGSTENHLISLPPFQEAFYCGWQIMPQAQCSFSFSVSESCHFNAHYKSVREMKMLKSGACHVTLYYLPFMVC